MGDAGWVSRRIRGLIPARSVSAWTARSTERAEPLALAAGRSGRDVKNYVRLNLEYEDAPSFCLTILINGQLSFMSFNPVCRLQPTARNLHKQETEQLISLLHLGLSLLL